MNTRAPRYVGCNLYHAKSIARKRGCALHSPLQGVCSNLCGNVEELFLFSSLFCSFSHFCNFFSSFNFFSNFFCNLNGLFSSLFSFCFNCFFCYFFFSWFFNNALWSSFLGFSCFLFLLSNWFSNQFHQYHRCVVALAVTKLHDASVATLTVCKQALRNLLKDFAYELFVAT